MVNASSLATLVVVGALVVFVAVVVVAFAPTLANVFSIFPLR